MKIRTLMVLPLAATLMAPAFAQQAPANSSQSQPAAAASESSSNAATSSDQNTSARQPLVPDTHEGFWGHLNPFARKKYVQRQMSPIRDRVNELDELTASNSKAIKDVDARAQEGIRQASAKADQADQHAVDAGNRAQQAQATADQATQHLQTVQQAVTNLDQYQPSTDAELRFRPGQSVLSTKAKEALDQIADSVKDQRGYIIEVQGFAPGASQASIAASQKMADSVVRYLVVDHQIPVYRIYTLGMGNAKLTPSGQTQQTDANGKPVRPYRGARVQVTVLKNSGVEQLNNQAMATPAGTMNAPATTNQGAPQSSPNTPAQPQ
ncbi:MAG TPA: OmpA family protein [Terriglobales bacterium]|nr:OmpA family protein [Terriglobales bacterium]